MEVRHLSWAVDKLIGSIFTLNLLDTAYTKIALAIIDDNRLCWFFHVVCIHECVPPLGTLFFTQETTVVEFRGGGRKICPDTILIQRFEPIRQTVRQNASCRYGGGPPP